MPCRFLSRTAALGGLLACLSTAVAVAAPTAALTVSPSPVAAGQGATLSGGGSAPSDGAGFSSWSYDFGDGTPAVTGGPGQVVTNATHAWGQPGCMVAGLTVNDGGGSARTTFPVTVQGPPVPRLTVKLVDARTVFVDAGQTTDPNAATGTQCAPQALTYRFDLNGDGDLADAGEAPQSTPNATTTLPADGNYNLRVEVSDGVSTAVASAPITVDVTGPAGAVTVVGRPRDGGKAWVAGRTFGVVTSAVRDTVTPAEQLTFRAGTSGPFVAAGALTASLEPNERYGNPVNVFGRDAAGNESLLGKTPAVDLDDTAPVLETTGVGTVIAGGVLRVDAFDAATPKQSANREPGGSGIGSAVVDWGDGTAPDLALPAAHTYSDAGVYTRTVAVSDAVGNMASKADRVTVTAGYASAATQRVGVVFDPRQAPKARKYQARKAHVVLNALKGAGVAAVPVDGAVLGSATKMSEYAVLVMPYIRALSFAERTQIVKYVKGGGGVMGIFYFGRDDSDYVGLTAPSKAAHSYRSCRGSAGNRICRRFAGSRWGGETEWANLSPLMGGTAVRPRKVTRLQPQQFKVRYDRPTTLFHNDVEARQLTIGLGPGEVAKKIREANGGGDVKLTLTKRSYPELVSPGRAMTPFLRYTQVKGAVDCIRARAGLCRARLKPGVAAAMSRDYGKGRAIWYGVPFDDALVSFERSHTPANIAAATAILVGSVDWAGRLR